MLPQCTKKAIDFIKRHVQSKRKQPFFLYFPLTAPHTPILPTKEFRGKSGIGPYSDFVLQCDDTVGCILRTLDQYGLSDNTLFIFTSDNGCSPMVRFDDLAKKGHYPSYVFRGHKADIFEGGHRIPFIVRWPEKIKANVTCDDTIWLTDLMATVADILGVPVPDNAGEDSVSSLPGLLGTAIEPVREATVHHSVNGSFSIRQGKWKLELCPGSGGWSAPKPAEAIKQNLPMIQLYDLSTDISERKNLQDQHPDVVHRLLTLLERYVQQGRSTPGVPQPNDGDPDIWLAIHKKHENQRRR